MKRRRRPKMGGIASSGKILMLLLAAALTVWTQAAPGSDISGWRKVVTKSADISFALPLPRCLVDNAGDSKDDAKKVTIYCRTPGLSLTVSGTERNDAKEVFKHFRTQPDEYYDYKHFQNGDFLIRQATAKEKKAGQRFYLQLASSHGSYTLSGYSREPVSPIYARFLQSVRLGSKPLFQQGNEPAPELPSVLINSLATDALVAEALKVPDSQQKAPDQPATATEVRIVENEDTETKMEELYSRGLIILRKPRAPYSDSAGRRNKTGIVRLRVTFLDSGRLGPIVMLSPLERSLDQNAFEAAKKMKFIPAEIAGKPVTVSRVVEYGFFIY